MVHLYSTLETSPWGDWVRAVLVLGSQEGLVGATGTLEEVVKSEVCAP